MKWKFADEISVVVVAVKNNMCDGAMLTSCIKIGTLLPLTNKSLKAKLLEYWKHLC